MSFRYPRRPSLPTVFAEREMIEEALSIYLVEGVLDSFGLGFRHFPDRRYRNFSDMVDGAWRKSSKRPT